MSFMITFIMFCSTVAISGAVGWYARIWLGLQSELEKTLTTELSAVNAELKDYQNNVNNHFEKTADLFNKILEQSKVFHDYLLTSAKELCHPEATIKSVNITSNQEIIIKSCNNNLVNNNIDHNWHPTFFEARDAVIDNKLNATDYAEITVNTSENIPEAFNTKK